MNSVIKTYQVAIYPNAHMKQYINSAFNYRRFCWNKALSLWNDMYDESIIMKNSKLKPTNYKVRNELVNQKEDWQFNQSSRVLQQTVIDLNNAWNHAFDKNMPNSFKPKFKSKKYYTPSFSTDTAKIINGKLLLDKPINISTSNWYSIRMSNKITFDEKIKKCTILKKGNKLYANIIIEQSYNASKPIKDEIVGVDINIKRMNYNDGIIETYPASLEMYYRRITHYQKVLARKRIDNPHNFRTNRYTKVITKLRRDYQKVSNLQNDIIQKFTTNLVNQYKEIHIEDLDVHHMMMSKRMGKNLHRSMFGRFSEILNYKCNWNTRTLVKVDRTYPSTQLCSQCGFRKTSNTYGGKQTLSGDSIHHKHQTYYCYNCGAILDRDENAVQNIINYKNNNIEQPNK